MDSRTQKATRRDADCREDSETPPGLSTSGIRHSRKLMC